MINDVMPMIAITITKYIQLIAEESPIFSCAILICCIFVITALSDLMQKSTMVYTQHTRNRGEIVGKVIFQSDSHAVQPSIAAASYELFGIVCSPDRKMMIWIPEASATS